MTPPHFGFAAEDLRRIEEQCPVARVEFHELLDSTNDRALEIARDEDAVLPTLVLAAQQTAGRGRGSNQWSSAAGSLTFSLVIEPPAELTTERLPLLSLLSALAVCETLESLLPAEHTIGLKWPNDVFLGGSKVCGILAESVATPHRRIVIGVGLNVNNDLAGVAADARHRPTSLTEVTGHTFHLVDVLTDLLVRLDRRVHAMECADDKWLDACHRFCALTGQTVAITSERDTVTGQCQGIATDGALLVIQGSDVRRLLSGTVVVMP